MRRIHASIHHSLRLTFLLAFLFMALFGALGLTLGNQIYPGTNAGSLLRLLSICCPFLYLQTTLSGILNGSGLQAHIFLYQLISSGLRIFILLTLGPVYGFTAFLAGLLVSLILSTLLSLHKITSTYHLKLQAMTSIILPFLSGVLTYLLINLLTHYSSIFSVSGTISLFLNLLLGSSLYFILLVLTKSITKKDLHEVLHLMKHNT